MRIKSICISGSGHGDEDLLPLSHHLSPTSTFPPDDFDTTTEDTAANRPSGFYPRRKPSEISITKKNKLLRQNAETGN